MIGFAEIVGGGLSASKGMADHLLHQTLKQDAADIARYYGRGGAPHSLMAEVAHAVVDGELTEEQAIDLLMEEQRALLPEPTFEEEAKYQVWTQFWDEKKERWTWRWIWTRDLWIEREQRLYEIENRLYDRLDKLVDRLSMDGGDVANLAVIRPDVHPLVMQGLGIEPDGILSREEVNALLSGRRADGELITGKQYAKERQLAVDPKTGERRWSQPIGSYDFCPSPDKTVSVAWAFATGAEQAAIYHAHIESAREAVAYIATEVGQARLGKGGTEGFEPGHVGWLEFTHHTTRRVQKEIREGESVRYEDAGMAGDPDLHTHFLIPNAVFCDSGRVGSLDTAAVRGFLFEAGAYYQARLAQRLRNSGFEVVKDERTGSARMPVIPDDIRSHFSKMTRRGEELARRYTAERGEVWEDLSQEERVFRMKRGTQNTAQRQSGLKDDIADVDDWRRQAKDAGWQIPDSFRLYGPPERTLTGEELHRAAYDVALPYLAEKLEHASVIKHWDLRLAALRGLIAKGIPGGLKDIGGVTKIMREEGVLQYGEKTDLISGQEEGRRYTSVTTVLHEAQELEFIRLAKAAAADRSGAIPECLLQTKLNASGLDFTDGHGRNQRKAIEALGHGGRFGMVIAAAGAGKTTALKPLVAAWAEQGRDVWGTSLASRQTDDLADAGISQRRLRAFGPMVEAIKDGTFVLTDRSVVAVDEWATVGTRRGLELLRLRERIGFTIVAVGDDKQTRAIEAGSVTDLSYRALGHEAVPVILTTKRQVTEREQKIVGLLREGRAAEALDMKRSDGTAEMVHGGPEAVIARVAKLYAERLEATGSAPSISAPTNADAHRISEAVRIERRRLGLVADDVKTIEATDGTRTYSMKLAKGDQIRLFRSTGAVYGNGKGGPIGRNGSVLEVVAIEDHGLTLKAKNGRIGLVHWDKLADPDSNHILLAYGTAMTIHTAQGSTAKEHIFALPSGSQSIDGASGYTASTRHRSVAYLVTSEMAERNMVRESRPLNDVHEITLDDKWANVARALAYQPTQDLAVLMIERAVKLKRWSTETFHKALMPSGSGKPDVADTAQRRHLAASMAKEAKTLMAGLRAGLERAQGAYRSVSDGLSWGR